MSARRDDFVDWRDSDSGLFADNVAAALIRRSLGCGVRFGLAALLLAPGAGVAQISSAPSPPVAARLSVRPREMATGIRTIQAGDQSLQLGSGGIANIYVPAQCVGTRRCPLVLSIGFFPRELANRHGMILFDVDPHPEYQDFTNGITSVDPGVPYLVREISTASSGHSGDQYIKDVDTALTRILRTYAIDPDKIAVSGNSYAGALSIILGRTNPDVFSRIAPRSPGTDLPLDSPTPTMPTTQFFFAAGVAEPDFFWSAMNVALATRRDGYPVRLVLVPQGHQPKVEIPYMFHWLQESWAAPEAARRAAQPRPVAPGPLLTADALTHWTTFWTRFMAEPDSIRHIAREAHIKGVATLVGREPVTLLITDLPALAVRSLAVAADLQAAGLSARQAEAYRVALLSAWTTLELQYIGRQQWVKNEVLAEALAVTPTSVLGRNMAFLAARPELIKTLRQKTYFDDNMWTTVP